MRGWGGILCAVWCLLACVVVGVRVQGGRAFDTDIQNLLPQTALEPVIRGAIGAAGRAASSRVALLISGPDYERVQAARTDLQSALEATGEFVPDAAAGDDLGAWLFANRNALMCDTRPQQFNADEVTRRADALLYSPLTPVSGEMLARDPFLLTLQLAQCLSPAARADVPLDAVVLTGNLTDSAFRLDVEDAVAQAVAQWRTRHPDVQLARAGAVFHAKVGAERARGEIALIAGVSTLAMLALLFACFRRPEAVVGTLAVTTAGAIGSFGAAFLLFPTVHVLVFVFGSALIGITSDYALHYLATGPQTGWAPPAERVREVSRPLAVCALATTLGFASLAMFGVAIFNQVAVFSAAGVLTAWWFTVTLLPLMDLRARKPEAMSAWWRKLEAPFLAFRWTRFHTVAGGVLALATLVVGLARFSVLDDVRRFQAPSAELVAEETRVREALGFTASPSFLLTYGDSADQARVRQEHVLGNWPEAAVGDVLALSRFDPSEARRAQNAEQLTRQLYEPHLQERVRRLGLERVDVAAGGVAQLPGFLTSLEGDVDGAHFIVAPLGPIAAQQSVNAEGATLVDPAGRYTLAFQSFRLLAAGAVAAAFAVCGLIVLVIYRRWRALRVLAPPAFGVAIGIALPSALGMPTSFFSVAALFVVIGAGIDHSVFQFEANETRGTAKELVVFLAALTTVLSMGLLAVSSTYPVASFGVVVAAGVTAAYLVSFVPTHVPEGEAHATHKS